MGIQDNQGRPKEIKNGQITTFYLEKETVTALDLIARREGVSKSKLGRKVLEDYVKAHAAGNNQYTLQHEFSSKGENFSAYPTPWDLLDYKKLEAYSWKEDDDMISKLERATKTLKSDRQTKRNADMAKKELSARL